MDTSKKYVVVLTHADDWGAQNANQLITHLHQHYPDLNVHLVVSRATKNKGGEIATKNKDLKTMRELKETHFKDYLDHIDHLYDITPSEEEIDEMYRSGEFNLPEGEEDMIDYQTRLGARMAKIHFPDLLTFKQLAKRYCADGEAHYTARGGIKGGEQAAEVITQLEEVYGHGPEVLLSVDTMAILPESVHQKYRCFSTHPGPLDRIKIEGMQGTERALANQILYDMYGDPMPKTHVFGMGLAHLKGSLFLQHPELDKGPLIDSVLSPVVPGVCAYQARQDLYSILVDQMIERLPELLDEKKREKLVAKATKAKMKLDKQKQEHVPDLDDEQFATWQGKVIGYANEAMPHGVEIVQNQIVDPQWFQSQMARYYPGLDDEFRHVYKGIYGDMIDRIIVQHEERLNDAWAKYLRGDTDVTITRYDPKTGNAIETLHNRGVEDDDTPGSKER